MGFVLDAALFAVKTMRETKGAGFDLGAALWRLARPASITDWLELGGLVAFAVIGGLFVAALTAARRGAGRQHGRPAGAPPGTDPGGPAGSDPGPPQLRYHPSQPIRLIRSGVHMARRQRPIRNAVAAILLLGLLQVQASARQEPAQEDAPDIAQLEQQYPTAPVMVDGVAVIRVRGVSSYPADRRAKTIADRIYAFAADPAVHVDALRIDETDLASQILADRHLVMNVYDADAKIEGVPRQVVATLYLARIRSAIMAYRADRSAPSLQRSAKAAAVATVVFVVLAVVVIWLRRKLDALLDSRYRQQIDALAAKSREVVSVTRLWKSLDAALRFVRSAAIFVLGLMYLRYMFELFPYTRPAARSVAGFVVAPLLTMWASSRGQDPRPVLPRDPRLRGADHPAHAPTVF